MSRKTRKRKDTVWIPSTMRLLKKMGSRTVKRVRFLVRNGSRRIRKIPSRADRVLSKTLRRLTR